MNLVTVCTVDPLYSMYWLLYCKQKKKQKKRKKINNSNNNQKKLTSKKKKGGGEGVWRDNVNVPYVKVFCITEELVW